MTLICSAWEDIRGILSGASSATRGHLSNEAAGDALCKLLNGSLKRVYLAHLSQEHNLMDLAKMTVDNVLQDNGIFYQKNELVLCETHYDRPTLWDTVKLAN
jgi:Metal-dependent hydrolases of the beta-lactamase superfamily I